MSAVAPRVDATEFAGKRVLVTGGSKGIGEAIVARLCLGGARVVTTARHRPAALRDDADFVEADVSTAERCAGVARHVLAHLGGIDIVVSNV